MWELQFEWAWQHTVESLAVRQVASTFKSLSGVANKIKLAYTMLTLPNWQRCAFSSSVGENVNVLSFCHNIILFGCSNSMI